jgi:hypothetical protein
LETLQFSGGSSFTGAAFVFLRPCYPAPAPSTGATLLQPSVGELDPSVDEVAWAGEGEASGRWDLSARKGGAMDSSGVDSLSLGSSGARSPGAVDART